MGARPAVVLASYALEPHVDRFFVPAAAPLTAAEQRMTSKESRLDPSAVPIESYPKPAVAGPAHGQTARERYQALKARQLE